MELKGNSLVTLACSWVVMFFGWPAPLEATLTAAETAGSYYSTQHPEWPPLPANVLGLPQAEVAAGVYLLDDEAVNYTALWQQSVLLNALESAMSAEGPPAPPGAGEGGGGSGGGVGAGGLVLRGDCTGRLEVPVYLGTNLVLTLTNASGEWYDLFTTPYLGITNWTYLGRWTNVTAPWVITNPPAFESYYTVGCTNDSDGDGLANIYEALVTHTDPDDPDTDYDGNSDGEETLVRVTNYCTGVWVTTTNLTAATNATVFTPKRLAWFRFNTNTWPGERGQLPLTNHAVELADAWATKGAQLTNSAAQLKYRTVETNDGQANINVRNGTVRFWFKPLWSSRSNNAPAAGARLLEVGQPNSDGWWALYWGGGGTNLFLSSQTNGGSAVTSFAAELALVSNQWYQIALTFTNGEILLYTNGVGAAGTADDFPYPGWLVRSNGFTLGSDTAGGSQARGLFDDFETFNHPLSAQQIWDDFEAFRPPNLISNVQQWLIGAEVTATNPVDRINVWLDQSGKTNHAVSSGSLRPYWVTNFVNGHPVVHFDGSTSFDAYLGSFVTNWTAVEGFAVARSANNKPAAAQSLWRFGTVGNPSYPGTTGEILDNFGSKSANYPVGSVPQGLTNFCLYNTMSRPDEWTARLNGVLKFQSATNTVGFLTSPKLGSGAGNFDGEIAEVLLFNRPLSSRERAGVNRYFGEKYLLLPAPQPPTNLNVNVLSPTQASVWWNAAANLNQTRYVVERSTNAIHFAPVAEVEGTSWIDSGLATNSSYYYRIKAVSLRGESGYTGCASITTAATGLPMPLDAGVLKLWLKADAGPLANHDGTVNQWLDQSGNTNLVLYPTTAGAGFRPYVVASAGTLNSLPTIKFFTTNWFEIRFTSSLASWTNAEAFLVLRAALEIPVASGPGHWRFGGGSGGGEYYPSIIGQIQDGFWRQSLVYFSPPTQLITNHHIYNVTSRTGEWIARLNGIPLLTNSTTTFTVPNYVPKLGTGQNPFDGEIIELLMFNNVLPQPKRDTINEYLKAKFQLE